MSTSHDRLWEEESNRYTERNLDKPSSLTHLEFLRKTGVRFRNVLQIGCSRGDQLGKLVEEYGCPGTGVEPGARAVETARKRWPKLKFEQASAQALPFENGSYELVVAVGLLAWIPRSQVMQAIGEIIRVSSRYILVVEFHPAQPHSTPYRDVPADQARTFKISTLPAFLSLNLVRLLHQETAHNEQGDWERRSSCLYEKLSLDEGYPLRAPGEVRK